MQFEELILEEERAMKAAYTIDEDFDLDTWMGYWMDTVDPRGTYRLNVEHAMLDAGGYY